MPVAMKRILLVMMQPPGGNGVQGLRYDKLLPYLDQYGWEFHFAGPSPLLASVITEEVHCHPSQLHYSKSVSWSKRFSVLKNRSSSYSAWFFIYGFLQLISLRLERLVGHDQLIYVLHGLRRVIREADAQFDFDLIAAKTPDFLVLEEVARLAGQMNKPFVAVYDDPHGHRDGVIFVPQDPDKQKNVLCQCRAAVFMSPMTRERYVKAGLVKPEKAYAMTDSYPGFPHLYASGTSGRLLRELDPALIGEHDVGAQLRLVHLGMLPEWRPIDALLNAMEELPVSVQFDFFGYVYPEAQQRILSSPELNRAFRLHKAVNYTESHLLAEDSTGMLVVIGPRHIDNQPSKFFEYLGHRKPFLVLGPKGNPIQDLIRQLEIGVYCDVADSISIRHGILEFARNYSYFVESYDRNLALIENYSAPKVAKKWADCLNAMLGQDS
jgi:glycosyltransferase involved in cell wall biosynthesis